jgi:DNA-directed RNA polymerase specialized sigma24 family protein
MTNAAVAQLDLRSIMGAITRREPKQYIDFAAVPPSQWAMHDRLENWARWCRGDSGESARTESSPMFEGYRSTEAHRIERGRYGELTEVSIDKLDAQAVAKGVAVLPDKHRRALNWAYLRPRNPTYQARELGVSLSGLAELVRNGRQMLINRRI